MTADEARILVGRHILYGKRWRDPCEARVIEVSPSGHYIKLKHPNGFEGWQPTDDVGLWDVLESKETNESR
ncbi:hypothetical protein M1N93_02995 [Dehalococcoidia bacterium]|nr:hypothetical protein [Dehalococcoidia bacterium]